MQKIENIDLIWDTDKYDVILLGTSIYNMLTQGFQSKMSLKYPDIVGANNKTPYADQRKLGKRITIDGTPTISIMYICGYPHSKRVYLDYNALDHALETANMEFKGKSVACPILGSSRFDGNGDKERCLKLIERRLNDVNLTVYDFPQYNKRQEVKMLLSKWNVYKKNKDWETYNKLLANKKAILSKMYLKR